MGVPVQTIGAARSFDTCAEADGCQIHGPLSQLGGEAAPKTVGEVRHTLRARLRAPAPNAQADTICVGGKQLPVDDGIVLGDLDVDLNGEVGTCPTSGPDFQCCPPASAKNAVAVEPKLGLERFLTLWILLAAIVGIGIGQIPNIEVLLSALRVGRTNMLTAIGMIVMLLPPFASAQYHKMPQSLAQLPKRIGVSSVITNWVLGPLLMLGLGLATLSQHGEFLQGVIFVGAARCIAMVLVWNAFAGGDQLLCVSLVLLNSVVTIFAFAPVVSVLGWLARINGVYVKSEVSFLTVLYNVLIYLGIPFVIGVGMWWAGHRHAAYEEKFLPRFAPVGLIALLWTVLWMFAEMSPSLISGSFPIADVCLVAVPLLLYFVLMFGLTWAFSRLVLGLSREQVVTLAFTAASNNFELALAATTAIFGTSSPQAVATIVGPLVEIPVMLLMVRASKLLR